MPEIPHELAEARRIAREFLAGQRLLVEQGRMRWLGEVLMPHKRHLGMFFARVHVYRVPPAPRTTTGGSS